MNKKKYWFAITTAALALQACSEKDIDTFTPVKEGSEIMFGAALYTSDNKTRTYYGEEITVGGKDVWPIYWNYNTTKDEIYIYSPQAVPGRNQQTYRVDATSAEMKTAANITRLGNFGIQASSSTTYDFYGLYPASAIISPMGGGASSPQVHARLPYNQDVTFAGTKADPKPVIPNPTAGSVAYLTKPDMNCCLMTASHTNVEPKENEPVSLQFKPFATVIDITIPGPTDNNTITNGKTASITSVQVIANAKIAGNFTYNYKSGSFEFGEDSSNIITINTKGTDAAGNEVGIPLQNQNTLNLQAFMIPNPAVTELTIKVTTIDSQTWTKNLVVSENGSDYLAESQINKVTLPPLKFKEASFDYSIWLSQLDPRIYISEISLPGSCLSFNTARNNLTGTNITQSLDIAEQFRAGIRVFQAHAWPVETESILDGKPRLNLVAATSNLGVDTGKGLLEIIEILEDEMKQNHGNEFCVLLLSDYKINGSPYTTDDFYQRYKVLSDEMAQRGLLADNVDANTTLADVKGKVILKFAPNGGSGIFDGGGYKGLNTALGNLQTVWNDLNGSKSLFNWFTSYATSNVAYMPFCFGDIGSFTNTQGSVVRGEWVSTGFLQGYYTYTYTAPELRVTSPGLACEAANMLINTTTHDSNRNEDVTLGNINGLSVPTADQGLNYNSKMWYIYSEEANPDQNKVSNNAKNVVDAISNTYNQASHNKFYMTYCGGNGGSSITTAGNNAWSNAIKIITVKRPYGWVLFNEVALQSANNTGTADNIQRVISNNNDNDFKLNRNKNGNTSPQGAKAKRGGVLFQ